MAKRRIIYDDDDDEGDDDVAVADTNDRSSVKKSRKVSDERQPEVAAAGQVGSRRSSRAGKGSGGRLAHMKAFEQVQTKQSKRPSKIEIATQGENVNPMAPSFLDAGERPPYHREVSEESTPPDTQTSQSSQPIFSLAAAGQQFSFRLPEVASQTAGATSSHTTTVPRPSFQASQPEIDTQAPPRTRFAGRVSESSSKQASSFSTGPSGRPSTTPTSRASSIVASQPSVPFQPEINTQAPSRTRFHGLVPEYSSRSASSRSTTSIFSTGSSGRGGTSTPPTSRAPSICSSTRSKQWNNSGPVSLFPRPSSSRTASEVGHRGSFQHEGSEQQDGDSRAPTLRNARLERTASFYHLPLSLDGAGHSITASPRDDEEDTFQIDEASPSEDDRFAEEILHRPSPPPGNDDPARVSYEPPADEIDNTLSFFGRADAQLQPEYNNQVGAQTRNSFTVTREAEDVVAAHRKRNPVPRLPSNTRLLAANQRQVSAAPRVNDRSNLPASHVTAQPQENPSVTETTEEVSLDASKPVGPATEGAEPWQLQYYNHSTRDIIERAKQFSHCDAASINPFPARPAFNIKAVEYINEAIAERRNRSLHVSGGWWPHHELGITRLLWEDLGNWRSALRKKARTFVAQRYQWDRENRREVNMEIARDLLGSGGLFLKDGVDDEGHVNNLAHPALAGLVIEFFYAGLASVGQLFPEVFSAEVPRAAVAIAATAIKVVLDEIVSGSRDVNFRVATYSPVYAEIIGLMNKCDTSPVHQVKTRSLRVRWAELGSNGMTKPEDAGPSSGSFDVDLA